MSDYIKELYKKGERHTGLLRIIPEQIDAMLEKMALRTYQNATELGTMVAEETRMGDAATSIGSMQRISPVRLALSEG